MHESSLPVWAVILMVSVMAELTLSFLNPFLTKEDKMRIKDFRKNGLSKNGQVLTVRLRYHFAGTVYIAIAMIANWAALVAFFISGLSDFVKTLGGGALGYTFAILCALFAIAIAEGIVIVIALAIEHKNATSMVRHYARYGVEILDEQ